MVRVVIDQLALSFACVEAEVSMKERELQNMAQMVEDAHMAQGTAPMEEHILATLHK